MENTNVLMIAVISSVDSDATIAALNENGFYVTVLGTTGGFLKKKNTTLMIGMDREKCDIVKNILKEHAGVREIPDYTACICGSHAEGSIPMASLPQVMRKVGGVTAFIVKLDTMEKF